MNVDASDPSSASLEPQALHEAIIFQIASTIHAHAFINVGEVEVTFGNLGPEGKHRSECLVCPDCGRLWGRIVRSTPKPHAWTVANAHCSEHGAGFSDRVAWAFADPRILADLSPRTMEFFLDVSLTASKHSPLGFL